MELLPHQNSLAHLCLWLLRLHVAKSRGSLGCTIIEMATGSNPWQELDHPSSAIHKIDFSGELPEFPNHLSNNTKDFLSKCLKWNAKERWTAKQLLSHQFLVELAFDFEKVVEKFNENSPTSVLDLGFWDSVEVSEPSMDPSKFIYSSDYSAQERIKGLIAYEVLPEWANDEDWVTVRTNSMENSSQVSRQNCDNTSIVSIHMELFDLIFFIEEQSQSESFIDIQDFCY